MKIDENRLQRNAFFKFKITMSPLGNTPEFSVHQTCLFSLPAFYQNNSKNHTILTKIDKISFVFINENDKISSKSVFSARGEHSTPMSGG